MAGMACWGLVGPGTAWFGLAGTAGSGASRGLRRGKGRSGRVWQSWHVVFRAGWLRRVPAGRGLAVMAAQGMAPRASLGMARQGEVCHVSACLGRPGLSRCGKTWGGLAGMAQMVSFGSARPGGADTAWFVVEGPGCLWLGRSWPGTAWQAGHRRGMSVAWLFSLTRGGTARQARVGSFRRGQAHHGMAGEATLVTARLGGARQAWLGVVESGAS
jgi:hypothetical protein